MHPNSLAKSVMAKTAWRSIANSWCLAATIATAASAGDFFAYVTPVWTPTSSASNPAPL
jgi:hypothetical protein